ncbi:immunoglobulin-like domain-containing protein [Hyalangium versicolor]|uniref:immunoglobulin-like domain-containing protein n=1 Tax=Hyalangium versicolor TaxID=2861190 RepID=UPI001CCF7A0E|nr:immunoglobulin-like domain-containing protein [Hyalangium versicolor]
MSLLAGSLLAGSCSPEQGAAELEPALEHESSPLQNANSTNKVLILSSSVKGGLNSREARAVAAASPTTEIQMVTPEKWKGMTPKEFMSYRALIIGDAACQSGAAAFQAAVDSRDSWGLIVDGDVAIFGTDPSNNNTEQLVENGIRFVLNSVQKRTGMYIALGCAYQNAPAGTPVQLLTPFGSFKVQGVPGCADSAHMFGMWGDLLSRDLWDGLLSGDGCAARSVFTSYPDHNFSFAAIAMKSSGAPVPGQRSYVDFLYDPGVDTAFGGAPYILVRGAEAQSAGCGLPNPTLDEQCDLGDDLNGMPAVKGQKARDTCSYSCHLQWCGDGAVDLNQGEECDEGVNNGRTGDARGEIGTCSASCKLTTQAPPPSNPPHALCRDVSTAAEMTCGVAASIDNGSYDPDGDLVSCSQTPAGPYGIGATVVTLTCVDRQGHTDACSGQVTVLDRVVPTLVLNGSAHPSMECTQGGAYADPWATANDLCDGALDAVRTGAVRAGVPADYSLKYSVTDSAGNSPPSVQRLVSVTDTLAPNILLKGPDAQSQECGTPYIDLGATALDQCAGNLTSELAVSGTVDAQVLGRYTLRYNVKDPAGHSAKEAARVVTVTDTQAPSVSLNGPREAQVECGGPGYMDPGATATDLCAGALPAVPTTVADPNVPGSYTIHYRATDPSGNTAVSANGRTVTVRDTLPPTISLLGSALPSLECGTPYADPGATARDQCAGDLTSSIVQSGSVDFHTLGTYPLTYSVADSAGHSASTQRKVKVSDTLPPSISLKGPLSVSLECGGDPFTDPGALADDVCAGQWPATPTTAANPNVPGTYDIHYAATDPSGNTATSTTSRTVRVSDTLPPSLSLNGSPSLSLECGSPYKDPGATARDQCSGDLTASIVQSGSVDSHAPGLYRLTYKVADGAGLQASGERSVTVSDTLAPLVSLVGPLNLAVECGDSSFVDPGATADDVCAGSLPAQPESLANPNVPGTYSIHYSSTDPSGNKGTSSSARTITVQDTLPPALSLLGSALLSLECGSPYSDPGATAHDQCTGDLSGAIVQSGSVDSSVPGDYMLTYSVADASGHSASAQRGVQVQDTLPPSISLRGPSTQDIECGTIYPDPGATATDLCAGDLTGFIIQTGELKAWVPGHYTLSYKVQDPSGHSASTFRTVNVRDTRPPSLMLAGPSELSLECGASFQDPGAQATDSCADDVNSRVQVSGQVDTGAPGTYLLSYGVTDPSGNAATPVHRTVTVKDSGAPVLSLNGPSTLTMECGEPYKDPGATALDACAGDVTARIEHSGTLDPHTPGSYTLHYLATDPSGQKAELDRAVQVVDTRAPSIACPEPLNVQVLEANEATVTPGAAMATDSCDLAVQVSQPDQTHFPLGTTELKYTAKDASGNTASCTTTVTVLLIKLPDTWILSGPPAETQDTEAQFEFAASKPDVTYECSLEGGEFMPCSKLTSLEGLSEGPHQLLVRARDSLGNVDPTPAQGTWTVLPPPIDWDRAVLGGGNGCASTGSGPSMLAMMGLAMALLTGRRRLSRERARTVPGLLGAAAMLLSAPSSAQTRQLPTFEMERLSLNPSAAGSLVLGTGELLPDGAYRVSLTGHYENDPLVFVQNGERLGSVVHYRATAHFSAAYGLMDKLEIGVQIPFLLSQRGDDLTARGLARPAEGPALGTPMLSARWRLLSERHEDPVDLSVGVQAGPRLGRAEALAREQRAIPSIMVGRRQGFLRGALDAGVLLRPRTILTPDSKIQDEIGYALRVGAMLATTGEGLRAETSVIAAVPLRREGTSFEAMGGVRMPVNASVEAYALGGLGYGTAPGTPDFRLLLGVAYVYTPPTCIAGGRHTPEQCPHLDDDEDGVSNGNDACPIEGGKVDEKGCPLEDTDGDGLEDRVDQCPREPGLPQFQGCPDQDTDGLPDAVDQCPTEPGPADHLGCPPKDSDEDGVLDEQDACPEVAGLPELNGCLPLDTDGDTLPDDLDNCPCQPGPPDNEGCPEKERQLVSIQRDRIALKETIHFEFNKVTIQPRSYPLLDQMVSVLNEHPNVISVLIEGHTDDWGPDDYNLSLSQRRAEAVRAYLAQHGVAPERMEAHGYGETRPVATNATPEGRAINRRVDFMTRSAEPRP